MGHGKKGDREKTFRWSSPEGGGVDLQGPAGVRGTAGGSYHKDGKVEKATQ